MKSENSMLLYLTKDAIEELDTEKKLIKLNKLLHHITKTLVENKQYNIPILRLPTNSSGEKEKLKDIYDMLNI